MNIEIKIPSMGESVSSATISRIIQPSGSLVTQDQEILEIETDKVNQMLYAPIAGKLQLSVTVGQAVTIGEVIGSISSTSQPSVAPPPPSSPLVTTSSRRRMSSLRRTIAQKLVEVKNTTAMLTSFNEVDMTQVMEIRAREKENFQKQHHVKLGLMSFFVKATVSALKLFPDVHSWIDQDDIAEFPNYDIGVAVSTDKGLMVPVIRGCDTASFAEIEKQIETYAKKAREGSISIDDLRGGCFTITNGGVFGSLLSTPILNPPQSAILGMHSIAKRVVVISDQIVIRPMMYLALSYDHRIIDGKEAVQFLIHIKEQLEEPSRLYK